jgi:hypothetical protein
VGRRWTTAGSSRTTPTLTWVPGYGGTAGAHGVQLGPPPFPGRLRPVGVMTRILCSVAFATGLGLVGPVAPTPPPPPRPSVALEWDAEVDRQEPSQAEQPAGATLEPRAALRLWKLTVALELDQKGASRFFAVFERFDARLAVLRKERWALARQLREMIRVSDSDSWTLSVLIDRLQLNRQRENDIEQERFAFLRQGLSLQQQARLLLILPRLEDGFRWRDR